MSSAEIYNLGKQHGKPQTVGGNAIPYVVLRDGNEESIVNLEHLLLQPLRKRGHYFFTDPGEMFQYIKRNKQSEEGGTTIWIDRRRPLWLLTVIIDDNGNNAGWKEWVCRCWCIPTEDYTSANIKDATKVDDVFGGMPPIPDEVNFKLPTNLLWEYRINKVTSTLKQCLIQIIQKLRSLKSNLSNRRRKPANN